MIQKEAKPVYFRYNYQGCFTPEGIDIKEFWLRTNLLYKQIVCAIIAFLINVATQIQPYQNAQDSASDII